MTMRDVMLLGTRFVLGGYLARARRAEAVRGLRRPGAGQGRGRVRAARLTPGKPMAALEGALELGGGLLTAAGAADPAGPLAIMGAMTVASVTHRANGPLAASRGYELPLTNLAAAAAVVASGPGRHRLGPSLSRRLTAAVAAGGALLAARCWRPDRSPGYSPRPAIRPVKPSRRPTRSPRLVPPGAPHQMGTENPAPPGPDDRTPGRQGSSHSPFRAGHRRRGQPGCRGAVLSWPC